jgi:hypothetical protein
MAEWLIERGIAETRCVLAEGDEILAARVEWEGDLAAGAILPARLIARRAGSPRGTAQLDDGTQVLVDRLPRTVSEGAQIHVAIIRPALHDGTRAKRAQGRVTQDDARPAPSMAEQLAQSGHDVREVRRLPPGWDELWLEAWTGQCDFAEGTLILSPTPAMTLIDVDGVGDPRTLALGAAKAIGKALPRFDLGGSAGVDFPTLERKADRRAVDDALEDALRGHAHERTAMNGFGFVQIVSRLARESLLHRLRRAPGAAAARLALRRAEQVEGPGITRLALNPAVADSIQPHWLDELRRRTAREVELVRDPSLETSAPHAQSVLR